MYGLIGYPLGHSFSEKFFTEKFLREGIHETYRLFPIDSIEKITALIANNPDLKGFNVTIPYKEKILPYLDSINEEAKRIGAVNVIKINRDEGGYFLSGYNSDIHGFKQSLLSYGINHTDKALILGSGGAAKAAREGLNQLGINSSFVSRFPGKDRLTYDELGKDIIETHSLIINATPIGMYPHVDETPSIPFEFISDSHICFDLIYNPGKTKFLTECEKRGAKIKNGLEMLHLQALKAWEIWNS